jgi:hypothetical protein
MSFRLGLREGGGGVGLTGWLARDRVQITADVFALRFGSYPAVAASGTPNLRLFVRWEAFRNVYFELGTEQLILGLANGFFTGYAGVGFRFRDDNLRAILAAVPGAL